MIYLAVALALVTVAYIVTLAVGARVTHSLIRSHARERDLLLNKLMHLAGRTWEPPPAQEPEPPEKFDELLDTSSMPYLDLA